MDLHGVWTRFKEHRGRWGTAAALYMRLMNRLRSRFLLWRVHVRDLRPKQDHPVTAGPEKIRIADMADLQRAATDEAVDISLEFVQAAVSRGDHCAAAFDGEQMVAYVWRSFSQAPFHTDARCELWISVQRPYRYGYKALTLPAYRGRKLQDRVARFSDTICLEKGYDQGLGLIETHNIASLHSDIGRGNKLVGYVAVLHLGGRTFVWRTRGAKHVGVHLFNYEPQAPEQPG